MNKTKRKILNAAFEVLAQDFSAPLEKIAEAADVTRMTLHRHFNTRQALVEATGLEFINTANDILEQAVAEHHHPQDQLKAILVHSAEIGERFHFLFHAMEEFDQEETLWAMGQAWRDKLAEIIEAVRTEGLLKAEIPTPWILHLYDAIMITSWSALREGGVAPRDVPDLAWLSFTQGVFKDEAPR